MADPFHPSKIGQGVAAGQSGGKYGFMTLQLSDKASKDFSDAITSIEKSAKMGAWGTMLQFTNAIINISENPMVQVFFQWLDYLSTMINAEFADSAQKLAEALFSESSQKAVRDLATTVGELNKVILPCIEGFQALDGAIRDITGGQVGLMNFLFGLAGVFGQLSTGAQTLWGWMEDLREAFKDAIDPIDDFIDKIKELLNLD